MQKPHILVVGSGSVGKRHAQNLAQLGCLVSCVDPRNDRRDELREAVKVEDTFTSMEEALSQPYSGAVVASPTSFHVDQSITLLKAGIPVLLEKPVAKDLDSAQRLAQTLKETQVPFLLGYTWRWWPPLRRVKTMLEAEHIGQLYHVRFVMSAHLADWHPWERYQDFFMSSVELGGGALLDESHWIDLMLWFFGKPEAIFAQIDRLSELEIETDDNVDIMVRFKNGLVVTLHLDLFGRPHEKSITFCGEKGTLRWSENRIAVGTDMESVWQEEVTSHDRNEMFIAVAQEFLRVLEGQPAKTCSLEDGIQVMQVIEAVRESSKKNTMVKIAI